MGFRVGEMVLLVGACNACIHRHPPACSNSLCTISDKFPPSSLFLPTNKERVQQVQRSCTFKDSFSILFYQISSFIIATPVFSQNKGRIKHGRSKSVSVELFTRNTRRNFKFRALGIAYLFPSNP